jgi:hypothetical protein
MDFHALVAKMKQLEQPQAAPVEQVTQECGMMPQSMPTPGKTDAPPPSMSVNLNAQGMDNIEQMMKLFQKVNPDMMPKIPSAPTATPIPDVTTGKLSLPALKMLPDFDADNDDKVGGEMDFEVEPTDTLDKLPLDHDKDHELVKTLDKDGDGDHDMDDHEMEPDNGIDSPDDDEKKEDGGFQSATTEPDEEYGTIDYMNNKLAGGMNRPKGTFPKVATGDNPMQRVRESDDDSFRASIRAELQKRLNEAKGAK